VNPPLKQQLSLLFPKPAAPAGKHDEIRYCSQCGEPIVARQYAGNAVESRFIDKQGRCYACTMGSRAR
jgi:hypothetical protein